LATQSPVCADALPAAIKRLASIAIRQLIRDVPKSVTELESRVLQGFLRKMKRRKGGEGGTAPLVEVIQTIKAF